MTAERSWIGLCQFAGRESFYFGPVIVRVEAPLHEVEAVLLCTLETILPEGLPRPSIRAIPGTVIVSLEE